LNIIHRDLKPENILIVDKDKNEFPRIKICDFGTSKIFERGITQRKAVGSPYYMAPEVLQKNYTEKCDIWSCGVILYILLSARPPFGGEDDEEIIESVQSGRIDLSSPPFNRVTKACLDLLKKLLTIDPTKRISAQEALNHKWFKDNTAKEIFNTIKDQRTIKKLIHNLKTYKRDSIIQEVALAYLVHNFPQMKEVVTANKLFNQIDLDGDGKINKVDLLKGLRTKTESRALEKDIDRIYRNIDMDNNGYIEYEEFVRAAVSKEKFVTDNILKFAFRYFDKNNSGEVSRDELEEIFKQGITDKSKMQKALDNIINEVDKNGDGIIQYEEFVAIMKKMLK
jgi:calcium-dependent protein kinase